MQFQRKNLMPAFTYRHTKDLYPLFWSKSCEMVRAIARESRTEEQASPGDRNITVVVDIASWVSRATLDIIGLAGMGQDFNALQDPQNELIRAYEGIFEQNSQAKILGILGLFLPRWFLRALPLARNQKLSGGVRTIRRVSHELIQQKKRKMGQEKRTDIDILSVALESGAFTDENLVDQMMTFLAAGHDTTATSLIWAVYQLSQQPEVQARLRDEIRQGLPSIDATAGPAITPQDLDRLPFLHAVCNEVLRLYPPVRITLRVAAHDTSIQGQFVPAGTLIILAPIATNTDVTLWGADAGEFKPERWLAPGRANTGGAESNYAFLTFLHGPRSCIGKEFARAEFACLLAALVGRFEMELADKDRVIELVGGITTKPKGGLPVRMRMLDGW
jgi:cytochrome P450